MTCYLCGLETHMIGPLTQIMAQPTDDLDVVPAHEDDIDRLMEIQFSAFEHDPIHPILYPGDHFSPSVRKAAGERAIYKWREDSNTRFMKCVDRQTGLALGFAKWKFYLNERSHEDYSKRPVVDWTTGRQKEVAENVLNANAAMREKVWKGKPHISKCYEANPEERERMLCAKVQLVLGLLCVHRDYQRRGVGKALVQWGLKQAKAVGLPAYLEASPDGFHLYCYLGFHQIDTVVIKSQDWDGDSDMNLIVMLKDP